ncbi:hypothetical protein LZK33_21040, partial [Pseudomonas aeruginosa]|nr:hypothetical protein [Pseudomonas aeruginosa]
DKWLLAAGMLLGRLEIITVLVLLTPAFGFGYRPGPGMPVGGVPGGAAR